jgi:rsbT co-antagonist protein RsbR
MSANFSRWSSDLPFSDPLEQRQASLLHRLLLVVLGGCVVGVLISLLTIRQNGLSTAFISYPLLIVCNAGALLLLRRGRLRLAANLATIGMILGISIPLVASGLLNGSGALLAFSVPVALAGLVSGRGGLLLAAGLTCAVVVITGALEAYTTGLVATIVPSNRSPLASAASVILVISVLSLFLDRFGSSLREALSAAREREQELEGLRGSLETTVAEHTASLKQALSDVEQREARLAAALDELKASQVAVRELSAPVIPVLPGVVIAPLIGSLDSSRASLLADNVLGMVERERARQVIFDITGVPLVDTQVAQVLLQTAAAVRLLGAQPLLVGIRPEVAQTIISLGLDFAAIATYPNLQEAVEALLPRSAGRGLNGVERAN